jgi:hypothetical protein
MFKILAECSATVRKAFEGIDHYVAEGGRALQVSFEMIHFFH